MIKIKNFLINYQQRETLLDKVYLQRNPAGNITLYAKKLYIFPLRSEIRQGYSLCTPIQYCIASPNY